MNLRLWLSAIGTLGLGAIQGFTQYSSVYLTDKIQQGAGVIDLLKDVAVADLQNRLTTQGGLLFAVDVSENSSGNETNSSQGVAIAAVTLRLKTTAGDFSFSDVFSNTTATIRNDAGVVQDYYTLFGKAGSSNLTSSTTGFDLARFDDLLELRNVSVSGDILDAKLEVAFVRTNPRDGANEEFFDFSNGFEDFALLNRLDAIQLESTAIGIADAPTTVSYTSAAVEETILAPTKTANPTLPAPGAPLPPMKLMIAAVVVVAVVAFRRRKGIA